MRQNLLLQNLQRRSHGLDEAQRGMSHAIQDDLL